MTTLSELIGEVLAFRNERNWKQFHTPRQLAAALSIEAAELQQLFLWKSRSEIAEGIEKQDLRAAAQREVADVIIYSLLFCDAVDIDPVTAVQEKLAENADKYPVDLAKGRATKYTDLRNADS